MEGKPTKNDVTVYNWTVTTTDQSVDANRTFNATFAFYQNMTITPYISWAQKDIDMKLGPPVQIRLYMLLLIFYPYESCPDYCVKVKNVP